MGTTKSELSGEAIVVSTLQGACDEAMVLKTFANNAKLRKQIPRGVKPKLLLNLTGLTSTDSAGRSAAKDIANSGYGRIAIVIHNLVISMAIQYVVTKLPLMTQPRFFRTTEAALTWLNLPDGEIDTKPRNFAVVMVALVSGGIGVVTLIGWWLANPYLTRTISTLRPMNPLAAVGLIILAVGLYGIWSHSRRLVRICAGLVMALGVISLLPVGSDSVLFKSQLAIAGSRTALADTAAICFIALGGAMLLGEGIRSRVARSCAIYGTAVICAVSIFGQLYAYDILYASAGNMVMSLQLAVGLWITALAIWLMAGRRPGRVTPIGWGVLTVLVLLQVVTYAIWSTTIAYNQGQSKDALTASVTTLRQSLSNRVNGYTEVLRGYSGLFQASDSVTQADFKAYYEALDLEAQYPGFKSISYVAIVNGNGLARFQAQQRADRSESAAGRPTFTIRSASTAPTHYVITYLGDETEPNNIGLDLSSVAGRSQVFQAASASQGAYLSGGIKVAAPVGQTPHEGFFISVPVKTRGAASDVGYVNTVFYYDVFFKQIFTENDTLRNIRITDKTNGQVMYSTGTITSDDTIQSFDTKVANHVWQVSAAVPTTYGNSDAQRYLPHAILITGQILSLMLIGLFWQLNRGRRRALKLAGDMTEDLNHERDQAIAARDKEDAILSSIGDAVFAIDTAGNLTLFNPAAARLSGYTPAEATGRPWQKILKLIHIDDGSINSRTIDNAAAGKVVTTKTDTTLVRKDGTRLPVAVSAAPIRRADDSIDGVIVIFRDISFDMQLDKAKTEFVSLASHQLRTPLSAINWYSEILLGGDAGDMNEEQRSYVTEIFEGNQRMIELVNALLDASRLELNKFTNATSDVVLKDQAESLHTELIGEITAKQLVFKSEVDPKTPVIVVDPKLSRIILQNLLSNAVKYTPNGGTVTLAIRPAEAAEAKAHRLHGHQYVMMSVKDNGFGIPKVQQDKIFGKMFRADNVLSTDVEGTGLGLYLVKQVVERLGGAIWFESTESIGTTFFVLVPLKTKES